MLAWHDIPEANKVTFWCKMYLFQCFYEYPWTRLDPSKYFEEISRPKFGPKCFWITGEPERAGEARRADSASFTKKGNRNDWVSGQTCLYPWTMWLKFEPAWNMASLRKVSPNPQPMAPATLSHKHCFISGKLKIFKMQMLLYISIAYKSYSDSQKHTLVSNMFSTWIHTHRWVRL